MASKTAEAEIFTRAAPTYDTVIPYFRVLAEAIVGLVDIRPGDRILDLACGRGACLSAAAPSLHSG
ncbi:MAG: hypothetical protein ACREV8_11170, partial [Gammaproteobacteria bacterium]